MSMLTCDKLRRLNALVTPGEMKAFDPFPQSFCLTDLVFDLSNFPEGLDSKAGCSVWLVSPGRSEILFNFHIDKYGHQVHLHSGIVCPEGSYLSVSSGVFVAGKTADVRVLMTGYTC
jgi:hypothetical protein